MSKENSSYNQIVKSTTIFGGSQVIMIIIGLVRTKIIALLLGTTGIGLIGIFQSVVDMVRSGSLLGMDTAGVKDVAEINSKGDDALFSKVVAGFNKWFRISAILALIVCVLFCYPISLWAFDSGDYAVHIALLSVAVSFLILTTGRSVILQGMRRIPELAKSMIWGSILGLVVTVPIYYIWRIDGIVPAFILSAFTGFLCVEYYYRKQEIKKAQVSVRESLVSGLATFKLGIYIVVAGFVGTLSMFLIRAFISRSIDLDAAGLFQSAWMITNVYLGLILRAMGSDFFPRLSAISADKAKIKTLVNEQTYIVLVIASPIIVGLLLLSDFALSILYSSEFIYADTILKWQILGSFFKVLGWPIAFILLAKGKGRLFLLTEIVFYVVYLLFSYLLYPAYGLDASGIGYFIAYIVYLPMVFFIVRTISGFVWNRDVLKMSLVNLLLISGVFLISTCYTGYMLIIGCPLLIISVIYAYFKLRRVFSIDDFKSWFKKR